MEDQSKAAVVAAVSWRDGCRRDGFASDMDQGGCHLEYQGKELQVGEYVLGYWHLTRKKRAGSWISLITFFEAFSMSFLMNMRLQASLGESSLG
ncbi:hypothetical protein RHGRI_033971 [Rhododendron griersonianum]|uniref:Uncharacterized protein n=1 Tax=Rhododendron griersonianum TaxID=479676 RepID=A0AAV6HYV0_9ERIC|nr:hypothetical protein RHGRI_033971 [Rhododendron griersonianum]